jgi:hypothetical protein
MLREITFFTLAACALPLSASTVLPLDFEQLARGADRVVSGRIVKLETQQPDGGYLYTSVTIQVEQASPSSLQGQTLEFRMVGGERAGLRQYIQGMPRFETGARVALFLTGSTDSPFGATVGLWQGVFFVGQEKTSGRSYMLDSEKQPIEAVRRGRVVRGRVPAEMLGVRQDDGQVPQALGLAEFFEQVRAARGE